MEDSILEQIFFLALFGQALSLLLLYPGPVRHGPLRARPPPLPRLRQRIGRGGRIARRDGAGEASHAGGVRRRSLQVGAN